jgi:hypothetical protein
MDDGWGVLGFITVRVGLGPKRTQRQLNVVIVLILVLHFMDHQSTSCS